MDVFAWIFGLLGFTAGYFSRGRQDKKDEEKRVRFSKDFDKMDELNAIQQKSEDDKVYRNYHSERTREMSETHIDDFFKTIKAIDEYHAALQRPKEEDFEAIDKAYKKYQYDCNKLKVSPHILTYEQYAIQQSNWIFCKTIRISNPMAVIYNIYDESTAKYKHRDFDEQLEKEFQEKFYKDFV
jgi:hypothetical protein